MEEMVGPARQSVGHKSRFDTVKGGARLLLHMHDPAERRRRDVTVLRGGSMAGGLDAE